MGDKTCEKWKDIEGYDGTYQVSDKGRVQYQNKKTGKMVLKSQYQKEEEGYSYVRLSKRKEELVHRLVAKAFINNPQNKETVHHKNAVKYCNFVENLEWMTQLENNQAHEDLKNKK